MNTASRISRTGAVSLGLLGAAALSAVLGAAPGCDGGSASTTSSGGNAPDAGTGGTGGSPVIFIAPEKCKSVGAANEVGPDHPNAQGQCLFLIDSWGTEVLDAWPPTDFMLDLMTSEPEVFGNQFAKFGFLADPNDDLPIGLKRGLGDPEKVRETCALCHVAELPDGRIWLGAPNTRLDFGRFQIEVDKRWVAAGHPPMLNEDAIEKAQGLGPGRINAASSDYAYLVAADFPPYFTLSERTHLNYIGTGNNLRTEAFFSIYSFGAGSPNDETAKVPFPPDDRVDAFLAVFGAFAPPDGPVQDAALVAKGKAVFETARCGSCHHPADIGEDEVVTYDKAPDGIERIPGDDPKWKKGSIRTDILHRVLIDPSVSPPSGSGGAGGTGGAGSTGTGTDTGYDDLIAFILGHGLSVGPTDGYRTSDLRGLWATPPYLHNGSVPTLDDLLDKATDRPVTWKRGDFLVDTTVLGNSNQGHELGTTLDAADKQALVAYLKSL